MSSPAADPTPRAGAPVAGWVEELLALGLPLERSAADDAARVQLIEQLERLKRAACAVQGDLAVDLDASQRAQQATAGVPAAHCGRGVAAQVALARRESPHRGQVFLGVARALRSELPHTREALRCGVVDEHAAGLVVRETACLEPEDRRDVDEDVCGDHDALLGTGTRQLAADVRRRAEALDPAAAVRRAARAVSERCVSLRPAPDTMAYLTGLVPMTDGVSAWATLRRDAEALIASGQAGARLRG